MYGIETPEKADQALRQVERSMFQQVREHPRDNLDNVDNIFPTSLKDDVLMFIHEYKRLPDKTETKWIMDVHLPKPAEIENLWGVLDFEKTLGKLSPVEWKQEYEQEFVMDNGDVTYCGGTSAAVGTITVDNAAIETNFETYVTSDAASGSALGSMKGINKYTLDHPGL